MKSYKELHCFFTVFLLCFVNLGYTADIPRLKKGCNFQLIDVKIAKVICQWFPLFCSHYGLTPIDNDPPTTQNSYSATEMCDVYSKLIYDIKNNPIPNNYVEDYTNLYDFNDPLLVSNKEAAAPKEFPHMALLGYSEKPDNDFWFCGGSLISRRFVLTAAHCEKVGIGDEPAYATWARLGELDFSTEIDDARPTDYKIVQRIIHPNYSSPSQYNDIALFYLERDVDFSKFVRPICLNADNMLTPSDIIATGWGKPEESQPQSTHLLKVHITSTPTEECNKRFLSPVKVNKKLTQGIFDNSILCAGIPESGNDTCTGESGGPIQIQHDLYGHMYLQIGITSLGGRPCGQGLPSVYTRVSNYISWIEKIVWPLM